MKVDEVKITIGEKTWCFYSSKKGKKAAYVTGTILKDFKEGRKSGNYAVRYYPFDLQYVYVCTNGLKEDFFRK
jgi:hypothetical protein